MKHTYVGAVIFGVHLDRVALSSFAIPSDDFALKAFNRHIGHHAVCSASDGPGRLR